MTRRRKWTDADLDEIAAWRADGVTYGEIAKTLTRRRGEKVSHSALIAVMHRERPEQANAGEAEEPHRDWKDEHLLEVLDMHSRGISHDRIVNVMRLRRGRGVSVHRIGQIVKDVTEASYQHFPAGDVHDGSMPPGWWRNRAAPAAATPEAA